MSPWSINSASLSVCMQPSNLSAQLYVTNKPSFWVLQFLHMSAQTTTQLSVHVLGCLSFFKIPLCPQSGWVPRDKQGCKLKLKTPNGALKINKMGYISNNRILSEMNYKHILFMVRKILLNIFFIYSLTVSCMYICVLIVPTPLSFSPRHFPTHLSLLPSCLLLMAFCWCGRTFWSK